MEGVEITLAPWAAHRLLGASMAELTDTVLEASSVLGRRIEHLTDELSRKPAASARFRALDRALLQWMAAAPASCKADVGVLQAWQLLHRSSGTITIRQLAEQVQYSTRHLEGLFRRQIGVSPKRLARVIRLNRAIHRLSRGSSLVDTALSCGYYDQPHLANEFKTMTGTTPGRFLGEAADGPSRLSAPSGPASGLNASRLGRFERYIIPHPDFH
ncbi:methylphosphotriester-DNA--protein-cysteine methyltransferase [Streptomyces sp. SPB4]|nr:methylphosphotriester-DNA--protein-cysteine methyltransferase [Streptomyces sp. SPB4]